MKHCLSVRSDLDTEEGRLLFANDIVERLFTRVWKDDKIMRRKRYFEEQPEAKRKGKLAQQALNHKAQNRKWHPGSVVTQSWEQFKHWFYPDRVCVYKDAVRIFCFVSRDVLLFHVI